MEPSLLKQTTAAYKIKVNFCPISRRTLSVAVAYESRLQLNLLPKLEKPTQDSIWHHCLIVPNCKASVCFKGSRSSNSVYSLLSSASLRDRGSHTYTWPVAVRLQVLQSAGFELLSQTFFQGESFKVRTLIPLCYPACLFCSVLFTSHWEHFRSKASLISVLQLW